MNSHRDMWIKARAYELWEEAGYPEGQHEEHWMQAEREFREKHADHDDTPGSAAEPEARDDEVRPKGDGI